jgi:hypothetical protein
LTAFTGTYHDGEVRAALSTLQKTAEEVMDSPTDQVSALPSATVSDASPCEPILYRPPYFVTENAQLWPVYHAPFTLRTLSTKTLATSGLLYEFGAVPYYATDIKLTP